MKPNHRTAQLAVLVLAFCCVCWGFSFPVLQISATVVDAAVGRSNGAAAGWRVTVASRASFNGWRFGAAGILYGLLTANRGNGRYRRDEVLGGLAVGLFFGVGILLQLVGLQFTLPSVSSFLTALTVVFAPVAQSAIFRRPVGGQVWLAVALALAGIVVLSGGNPLASADHTLAVAPPVPYLGQTLTILSAVLFTGQLLSLDRFGQRADPMRLTTAMLLTTAILNAAIGAVLGGHAIDRPAIFASLLHNATFDWSFVSLVLFSTVLGIHLMNVWQPRIAPATAAVVYCLEPVFGTLFSVAFHTERLTLLTLAGGAIILLAVLIIARKPEAPQDALVDRHSPTAANDDWR